MNFLDRVPHAHLDGAAGWIAFKRLGEQRDEVAEHVAGGRETMQQQKLGAPLGPALR
jgi:hypothetical protein